MGWDVEALVEMGANRWQKYNKDRLYLSGCGAQIMGLVVDYYKTGNVSSAKLDGEKISNADAYRYMAAYEKAYIDMTNGKIYGCCGRYADTFVEAMNAYRV